MKNDADVVFMMEIVDPDGDTVEVHIFKTREDAQRCASEENAKPEASSSSRSNWGTKITKFEVWSSAEEYLRS